jgi:hypothetical protein
LRGGTTKQPFFIGSLRGACNEATC